MRTSGIVIVVTAILGLSACRCNKAPGPQTMPSAQPVAVATAPISASASVDAGAAPAAGDVAAVAAVVAVVPLEFTPAKGSKWKPLKLQQDGSLVRSTKDAAAGDKSGAAGAAGAHPDKVVAKLVGDKLSDDDGSPIATFEPSGTIAIAGAKSATFKFNEKDELEGPSGLTISVADDGTPTIVPKAKAPPEKLTGKFVNFEPKARRAALVMLALHELKDAAKAAQPPAAKDAKAEPKKDKKDKKGKKKGKKKNKKN